MIHLTIEPRSWRGITRREIVRRAEAMLALLQLQDSELSIVLTDDDHIHELNKVYRGKDKPTDVLAFAMREGKFSNLAGELLGDVIVSIPTARRQAAERNVPPLAEVTMLLAHGLLHLLGWDHDTPARDRAMRKETDRLCDAATRPPKGGVTRRPRATGTEPEHRARRTSNQKAPRSRAQRRELQVHNGGFRHAF